MALFSIKDSDFSPITKPGEEFSLSVDSKTKAARNSSGTGAIQTYGRDRSGEIANEYRLRFLSPEYVINGQSRYDMVIGYLNEDYREELRAKWENAISLDMNTIDQALQFAFNKTTKSMIMYRQVWEGNDPLEGKFILIFDAEDSAFNDVYRPFRALQKMAAPGLGLLLGEKIGIKTLTPPVPSAASPSNGVTISVGRMFEYVGCVITSVGVSWSQKMASDGYPIHADVEVNFRLVNPVTKLDFDV